MKFSRFATLLILLPALACNQNNKNKTEQVKKIKQEAGKVNDSGNAFVQAAHLDVTGPSAVYFHPDSAKLQKLEDSLGEKFFASAEELMGDLSTSRDFLIKQHIRIIETEARRLTFKKADGSVKTIDLSSTDYTWGLFVFNGTDDPLKVDMGNPEKQVTAYMK